MPSPLALAHDAVCIPDMFGFNAALELEYRSRLDASRTTLVTIARRELFGRCAVIAGTGTGPAEQSSWTVRSNGSSTPQQRRMLTRRVTNSAGGLDVDRGDLGDVRSKSYWWNFRRTA
jgi:hypothetical protein